MKIIDNEKELVGKTIIKAEFVDYQESLVLTFSGGYCIVAVESGDTCQLEFGLRDDLSTKDQFKSGIISEDEYTLYMDAREVELKEWRRRQYKILKDEFSSDVD